MSPPAGVSAPSREAIHDLLMRRAVGHGNDACLAQILASASAGEAALPAHLGLGAERLRALLGYHFPGARLGTVGAGAVDPQRREEIDDLAGLMRAGRDESAHDESASWLADIVAVACMGMDHLWQDLGLWSRAELSALMQRNFPTLAARNSRDMKWKKFLYKQLCEQEGIYVCRAPSCDVCADFDVCFGPED